MALPRGGSKSESGSGKGGPRRLDVDRLFVSPEKNFLSLAVTVFGDCAIGELEGGGKMAACRSALVDH